MAYIHVPHIIALVVHPIHGGGLNQSMQREVHLIIIAGSLPM